ncbi:hypothetical protein ACFVHB_11015 [Kitasatospora sp. NPDC127111]|uniref:hypothetical protein n=1 Tax=Kitasatospora sp. NPDC127111 TaxID=3345363 RepID=UPI003625990B
MYVIRVRLETRGGRPPGGPVVAPAVRDGLERALRGPATGLSHARIRVAAGVLDAVLFVTAAGLLAAEAGVRAACAELTGAEGLLAGWRVRHCEADSWLVLGLHELPTHR